MTARILTHPRFRKRPPVRLIREAEDALCLLRIAELRSGVEAAEATADDLERLHDAVLDVIAERNGGIV